MPFVPKILFSEFKEMVERTLEARGDKRAAEKEYKLRVGKEAIAYKQRFVSNRPERQNERWKAWLAEAEQGFDQDWHLVENLNDDKVNKLADPGTSAIVHAYAIHYRMHMHSGEDELGSGFITRT